MPINMNDPYVEDEWIPASISSIGTALKRYYQQPNSSFGARGNEFHASGYHRSERWIRNSVDSLRKDQDYSLRGAINHSQDANAISAFDFIPHQWGTALNNQRMIEITTRVYNAARANDRRLANLYEFAGTLDGVHVITFNAQGGATKTPFDSSHLEHVHGSIYRSRSLNDHIGITSVMLGDADMALTEEERSRLDWINFYSDALAHMRPTTIGPNDAREPMAVVTAIQAIGSAVVVIGQTVNELKARPAVPPVSLSEAQVVQLSGLVASALSENTAFLEAVATATANKLKNRLEN